MRVLLDTNVLVSAMATRGLCADVLRAVTAGHELLLSAPLTAELRRVLRTKLRVPGDLADEAVALLMQGAVLADPKPPAKVRLKDKSDLPILSSAVNGGAEVLVTGDGELLALGRVGKLEILSPRRFWEKIQRRRPRGRGRR